MQIEYVQCLKFEVYEIKLVYLHYAMSTSIRIQGMEYANTIKTKNMYFLFLF